MPSEDSHYPPIPLDGLALEFGTFMDLNCFATEMDIPLNDALSLALKDWLQGVTPHKISVQH